MLTDEHGVECVDEIETDERDMTPEEHGMQLAAHYGDTIYFVHPNQ